MEDQFQTTLLAKDIKFLIWKFRSIILIFLLFFARIVNSTSFCTLLMLFPKGLIIWVTFLRQIAIFQIKKVHRLNWTFPFFSEFFFLKFFFVASEAKIEWTGNHYWMATTFIAQCTWCIIKLLTRSDLLLTNVNWLDWIWSVISFH